MILFSYSTTNYYYKFKISISSFFLLVIQLIRFNRALDLKKKLYFSWECKKTGYSHSVSQQESYLATARIFKNYKEK